MNKPLRWRKMRDDETAKVEALLQSQERWCMNACSRYITRIEKKDTVWLLENEIIEDEILEKSTVDTSILIIHSKQNLLPVLYGRKEVPPPHFLRGLLGPHPIHSLQGRKEDVLVMQAALEQLGLYAAEQIEYDLMCINDPPSNYDTNSPVNLIIRKPELADMDSLIVLHAAYEQEEVLPAASKFSPHISRMNMERIFSKEQMFVAELDGRLIGKINTNATTFTRYQVGGVYVHPDYRGLGIACRMAGEFTASLVAQGRSISLFVKKNNLAARRVYQRIGFEIFGDYQINYF